MPPPSSQRSSHNDEIRRYVLQRDKKCCQWPGCGSTSGIDVLFLIETEGGTPSPGEAYYKNGVTLCPKHMDIVNLHDKAFGPLIFDLIQLVEFERDLDRTERTYKDILSK